MDFAQLFSDPRRRTLSMLAGATFIAVVLALLAIWQQSSHDQPTTVSQEFLPGFVQQVREAARIHIVSKSGGTFDVAFVPDKGWVLPGRSDFPASFDLVRRTLVGLAALTTIEPKTARADWLHYVGLETPPAGDGIAITVSDDKGRTLVSLITGKSVDIGDPSGATGLFVRRASEAQTWLVRSVLDPRSALSDWMDKTVMDVDRARIREVDVNPAGSPAFVVSRVKPSDPDFTLSPIPAGKKVSDPTVPDGVASAITGFGFDDVRPARELDFSNTANTARLVTRTFDGLVVSASVQRQGADYWATISAEAVNPAAAKEATAINAHASGWAYKLPGYKGQLFMTTLESLLRVPPAAPAAQ